TATPSPCRRLVPRASSTMRGGAGRELGLLLRGCRDLREHLVHGLLTLENGRQLVVRDFCPDVAEVDLVPPAMSEPRVLHESTATSNRLDVAPGRQRKAERGPLPRPDLAGQIAQERPGGCLVLGVLRHRVRDGEGEVPARLALRHRREGVAEVWEGVLQIPEQPVVFECDRDLLLAEGLTAPTGTKVVRRRRETILDQVDVEVHGDPERGRLCVLELPGSARLV